MLLGSLGLAILSLGLLSLLLIWYRWGRYEPVPLPAEYIPYSAVRFAAWYRSLSSGRKALDQGRGPASLFHLATLGLLRIRLAPEINVRRNWAQTLSPGQTVETADGRTLAISEHLVMLFNDLSPAIPTGSGKELDEIARPFQAALPKVYEQMAKEVGPLFDTLPGKAQQSMAWDRHTADLRYQPAIGFMLQLYPRFQRLGLSSIGTGSLLACGGYRLGGSQPMDAPAQPSRGGRGGEMACVSALPAQFERVRKSGRGARDPGPPLRLCRGPGRGRSKALRDAEDLGAQLPLCMLPIDIALQDVDIDLSSSSSESHPGKSR